MSDIENLSGQDRKIQYILNEHGELTEFPKEKCIPVEYPIKYRVRNAFEVFVRVEYTENYWISNYGRCVNNYNRKDKNTFYIHKEGDVHYTVFEIDIDGTKYRRETSPAELVAKAFLVRYGGRTKVWHKDGDNSNNWYKNLLYVSPKEYKNLKAGKITWQELNRQQEYIEYENKATVHAYKVYNGILARCGDTVDDDNVRSCYDKSTMWQGWLDNPKSFVKWYLEHYYECDDEEMDVDKDLFGDGSGMYCPDFCCILPKGLNTLLANSKKHYKEEQTEDNVLPLGVRYSGKTGKYYGEIQFTGTERAISLSEWNTAEEAFAEYKIMKQADIMTVVARYKNKIPEYIYKRFFTVDVKPY